MIKKAFSYIGIFFLYALSILPMKVLYVFATLLYYLIYYVFGYRRTVVRTNLKNSFPEKGEKEIELIEKRFFKYLAALIFEIIKMSTISKKELQKRFKFINMDRINDYLERGESVLACSGHYGNWEWGTLSIGLSFKALNYPIYKPLSNQVFDQWFYHIRTRFGNRMIAMKQTFRALSETKELTTVFCFGNDQAPPKSESHRWINFLNQQTSFQQGIEKVGIKTKRPIFYLKVTVLKKGYYEIDCIPLCLHPEQVSAQEITDLHVRLLEQTIINEPAYWLWSHRRWKHQPTLQPEG